MPVPFAGVLNHSSAGTIMRDMSLWADFQGNGERRVIHKWKHYFPIYERHFRPFVNRSVSVLEIGCGDGGSLQMWKRYFGPHAQIVGIDIEPRCRNFEEDQIAVRIGSQDDPAFLTRVVEEFGPFDVVIDDGSHVQAHVAASFTHLYAGLSKNGVYLVEDLHTAYWPDFGGGLGKPDTFIEIAKQLIDELNADHARDTSAATEFTRTTHAICFYDSVIVFERGRYTKKFAPRIGREENKRR
ncbi:MAG: class I SAM-dependent methyltransferase [Candidatus Lustribacter sp.]|jgi:SAM-dependent methyltransferase